jgi:hypothetical protein
MGTRENHYNDVEQTLRNGNSMGTRENDYKNKNEIYENELYYYNSSKFIFKYARFQIWKQLIKNKLSFIEIS